MVLFVCLLIDRNDMPEKDVLKRLANARAEIEAAQTEPLFDVIIVNDDLDRAYREVSEFVRSEVEAVSRASRTQS